MSELVYQNENLQVWDEAEWKRALDLARGRYQEALLMGEQRLSGADLKGRAKEWSASYYRSQKNLLARLTAAGIKWSEATGAHGRRILVIGKE